MQVIIAEVVVVGLFVVFELLPVLSKRGPWWWEGIHEI